MERGCRWRVGFSNSSSVSTPEKFWLWSLWKILIIFHSKKNYNCPHLEKFLSLSTLKKILTIIPWKFWSSSFWKKKHRSFSLWENFDRPLVACLKECWRLPYKWCRFKESPMRLLVVRDAAQTMVHGCLLQSWLVDSNFSNGVLWYFRIDGPFPWCVMQIMWSWGWLWRNS